jgi:hypothetical protein
MAYEITEKKAIVWIDWQIDVSGIVDSSLLKVYGILENLVYDSQQYKTIARIMTRVDYRKFTNIHK